MTGVPAKICGLTRAEDARAAVRLGASWLGVIFAGGPRQVNPDQARSIVAVAGAIPVIGVFGSQGTGEILQLCEQVGLSGAQLHGGATAETVATLHAAGLEILTVARLAGPADLDELDQQRQLGCPIIIEPRIPGKLGGNGVTLSLELARSARERLRGHRMFLAGGLTPENVAAAVAAVGPDAVDVSSGVEQIPGIKDQQRMTDFLGALR
ncbi:MAG: phosphoribosylanthranilate isomerase [Gemmatimonadales bacterium]